MKLSDKLPVVRILFYKNPLSTVKKLWADMKNYSKSFLCLDEENISQLFF
jgi:hypothetical protein